MPRQPAQPTPDQPEHLTPEQAQAQAPVPGFLQLPAPLPGEANPDQLPPGASAASGSSEPSPPTRIELPKARVKSYREIAKGLFHAVSGLLNRAIAVDDEDTSFLPDDDDDAAVPPPLGRLAARRIPIGKEGDDLTDIEDLATLIIGLLAWGAKGLTDHLNARRERGPAGRRKKGPKGAAVFGGTGDQDQAQDPA
jgi:hypothetical protein